MARTLVLGRAGAGKTTRILRDLAERIRAGTDASLLLLVPTYGRAEHLKRAILRHLEVVAPGREAFLDRSIVTFTSLAERVLGGTAIGALPSAARRDRLLADAVAGAVAAGEAAAFRAVASFPGFRARFLALVKEVKEGALPGEDEVRAAPAAGGDDGAAAFLAARDGRIAAALDALAASLPGAAARRRAAAFAAVHARYARLLRAAGLVDHEDFQALLLFRVLRAPGLPARLAGVARLAVDGFTSFTPLQARVVEALAERVADAEVTVAYDAARDDLFAPTADARARLVAAGWRVETLDGPRRFAAEARDLSRLEASLFHGRPPAACPPDAAASVRILDAADPADEADRVARTAALWVRRDGWRPGEILVIHRAPAAVRALHEEAFARHGVPFRAFAGRPVLEEPVARAALDLVRLALGDDDAGTALRAVRSAYTAGADAREGDLLAEAAAAAPPRSAADVARMADDVGLRGAAALLRRLVPAADPASGASGAPAAATPGVLWDRLLAAVAVPDRLLPVYATPGPVAAERAAAEAAALAAFQRCAAEEVLARGGESGPPVDPATFLSDFAASLARATFQPVDRRLHAVNMVDPEEARQWEARGVILCGLHEKEFPRAPREDLFVRDDDRRRAAAPDAPAGAAPPASGPPPATLSLPPRLRAREEERLLFYFACTRARERLVLAWAAAGEDGARRLPSSFLDEALRIWPAGEAPRSASSPADPAPVPGEETSDGDLLRGALLRIAGSVPRGSAAEERMLAAGTLLDALAAPRPPRGRATMRARGRPRRGAAAPMPSSRADSAAALRRRAREDAARLRHDLAAAAAVAMDPRPALRSRALRGPLVAPLRTSASALASFHQCPYLHFARHVLRLAAPDRREEEGLDPMLLGSIVHRALERCFERGGRGDPGATFDGAAAELLGGVPLDLDGRSALARAREAVTAFAPAEAVRLAAHGRRAIGREVAFGLGGAPALELLAGALRILVRGRIDRLDALPDGTVVAVDYKWSATRGRRYRAREHAEALEGADPQVPLYLLAVRDALGRRPAGVEIVDVRLGTVTGLRSPGAPATVAPDRGAVVLDEAALAEVERRVREFAAGVARAMARGDVGTRPRDGRRCGTACDAFDLCRFRGPPADSGIAGPGTGRASATAAAAPGHGEVP